MRTSTGARRITSRVSSSGAFAFAVLAGLACGGGERETTPARPDIVVILTDDQASSSLQFMPNTEALLVREGTSFSNFFINDPICCPSRVTILLGQYHHNHGIESAPAPSSCGHRFMSEGEHRRSLGKRAHDAGYRTGYIGKYLNKHNRYIAQVGPEEKADHLFVGWDDYHVTLGNRFYGFVMHENGQLARRAKSERFYQTDELGRLATEFIYASAEEGAQFLLFIATTAPHEPARPAERHRKHFPQARAPRVPSFNEADVSGQPALRESPALSAEQITGIDARYRQQLRSLQAVDEMVQDVVWTLESVGRLENAYLVFASDNGLHFGEHRLIWGKGTPFEESVRVPLVIRGPGVGKGREVRQLVTNADLLPTLLELIGAAHGEEIDGRSLVPLFGPGAASVPWRNAVVLESRHELRNQGVPAFGAVRTSRFKWIEYENGGRALYDLANDPYEMTNTYGEETEAIAAALSAWLHDLLACSGSACRATENEARVERLAGR